MAMWIHAVGQLPTCLPYTYRRNRTLPCMQRTEALPQETPRILAVYVSLYVTLQVVCSHDWSRPSAVGCTGSTQSAWHVPHRAQHHPAGAPCPDCLP